MLNGLFYNYTEHEIIVENLLNNLCNFVNQLMLSLVLLAEDEKRILLTFLHTFLRAMMRSIC